jgi:molybdopterin converting factor subunit 1
MKVRVKLFAVAKERAGRDDVTVDVPDGATVAVVRSAIAVECPALTAVLPHSVFAVDAEYAHDNAPVNERSEVALIPPVSGG